MCSACGFPAAPGRWTEAGAATAPDRLRERFRRAELLRSVLKSHGLTAHDDGLAGLQVATLAGNQSIVRNLEEVWALAEKLSGRAVDPLDRRFIGEADEDR